ncbi:intraflagellar transport protein 140 homolog [Plutella xylostella]|uniref:intraflagellar transport protein 140 homolog n=1 Tax=Plutella xylostella TaxID=51655 RepID=UPI0020323259|nr:intraflagellar transport protein 140 homolog [Plutella xylostella]
MTLYIDTKLNFSDVNIVSTIAAWHSSLPLLAVGSYNQEKGGFITIFQESGVELEGCEWPVLISNQVTALAWHPSRRLLVAGWDGGELYIWLEYSWARLEAPHNAALTSIQFSLGGGRLIASDAAGSMSGWQSASGAPLTSFHHQLNDVITNLVFCAPRPSGEASIRGLARAAVAGDENALDALAAWRPRTTARMREGSLPDSHSCYASQDNGAILYIDHTGSCSEVLNAPGNIIFMGIISNIYLLVAWESGGALSLTRFMTANDGSLTTDTHVRMAARNGQSVVLAGNFYVAVIAGDNIIRIWDSETGDNDVLPNEKEEIAEGDIFTSINYCTLSDTLCCGTSQGHLYLWRRDHRNSWKLISSTSVKGTVKEVSWGSEGLMNPLLHVNCITSAFILREQPICWGYSPEVTMVQKSATEIAVANKAGLSTSINTIITVRAMAYKDQYVAIGDGKEVQVWLSSKDNNVKFSLIHSFSWKTDVLVIHSDMLVGIVATHVESRSVSGLALGALPTSEGEGEPIGLTSTGRFLLVSTMDGTLKLAEITKKGLKMPFPAKNCYQMIEDFGEVMRAAVNCTGRYICLSIANSALAPDPRLHLWDAANDVITQTVADPAAQRVPLAIVWDAHDARLLAVHTRSADSDRVHLYFCHEGRLFEYRHWCPQAELYNLSDFMMCTLQAPHVVILTQQTLKQITLNEFQDLKDPDAATARQMLDFLYHMTIGSLEKAVVVGSNIAGGKSSVIWNSLAKECVSCKRPDMGSVCLGKMGNIKGALMMNKVMEDPNMDDDSKVGVLAVNLGMLAEAEKLFSQAQRPDLVTRLKSAQDGGLAEITTGPSEGENVLLIKRAQHKLANLLWANGETGAALKLFEQAGTVVPHVPRMMTAQGQTQLLAQYVATSNDTQLILWWGHYLESVGDMDGALDAYARAKDFGEQTRLLCHMDRIEEAEKLCDKDKAAMYQMARYLEMQPDKTESAVKMYLQAGIPTAAIRVASEAQSWGLVRRAGGAGPAHALQAACALDAAGRSRDAILMYQRAGKPHMALKLALSCGDTTALAQCVQSVGRVEPALAQTVAARLRSAGQHAHAAAALAASGQYEEALDIVEADTSPLTEELSEQLAAPAGTRGRDALLRRLADVLGARSLYHQAAKRLAQAGDKAGAMRWLMRSGDVDRVATFAAASHDRTAQLMAADYLRRHADWRMRPDLTRHILQFYTKAKAYGKLAGFYAECAKTEVDEYENYPKALDALKEATKCLSKASDPETETQMIALQEQSTLLKRYIDVKKTLEAGEINPGVTSGQQLIRALGGRAGLVDEERVLRLMLHHAPNHPDAPAFEQRLKSLQSRPQEDTQSTDSPDQSIEEVF